MDLESIRQDYVDNHMPKDYCLYASFLGTNDLCIWVDENYVSVGDVRDYLTKIVNQEEVRLLFETLDTEQIQRIKHILGIADYLKGTDELINEINNRQVLSLK